MGHLVTTSFKANLRLSSVVSKPPYFFHLLSHMAVANPETRRQALHQVTDLVRGVNWRPTLFADEATLDCYACWVCHALPSTTVLLPCSHGVCRRCLVSCLDQNGHSVCPMDGEPFSEDECQELNIPERKKEDLKAYCWNKPYGCDFVGSLAGVLQHFEEECGFHSSCCRKCGEFIMNDMLAAHYIAHLDYRQPFPDTARFPAER